MVSTRLSRCICPAGMCILWLRFRSLRLFRDDLIQPCRDIHARFGPLEAGRLQLRFRFIEALRRSRVRIGEAIKHMFQATRRTAPIDAEKDQTEPKGCTE